MSDEILIEALEKAKELKLDSGFINILEEEVSGRGLKVKQVNRTLL